MCENALTKGDIYMKFNIKFVQETCKKQKGSKTPEENVTMSVEVKGALLKVMIFLILIWQEFT